LTEHPSRLVLKNNSRFRQKFFELKQGDIVSCILNLRPCEEYIFLDLVERGIILFPPALSQMAARSKCCQATLFSSWMHPLTKVIRKKSDLARAVEIFTSEGCGEVVTKLDRSDCGLGVCRWESIESLFSNVAFSAVPPYPFVVQPFIAHAMDIRIVWIGNVYREAYWRKNKDGFRNNLHFGGESGRYELSTQEEEICLAVMERGKFPYAHIDLLRTRQGQIYFSEISLFGGLRGAQINVKEAMAMKEAVEKDFLDSRKVS